MSLHCWYLIFSLYRGGRSIGGIYGTRNSTSLFKLDVLRNKKTLLQNDDVDNTRTLASAGQGVSSSSLSSPNLRLTCSDDDFSSAFASVRPAVVNITADRVTQRRGVLASTVTFDDPAIRFVEEQSLGSGIIIDPRGYIVTNAHVVSTAQNIKVVTF